LVLISIVPKGYLADRCGVKLIAWVVAARVIYCTKEADPIINERLSRECTKFVIAMTAASESSIDCLGGLGTDRVDRRPACSLL